MAKRIVGGQKLRRWLKTANTAQRRGVRVVEVGFFATARYPSVHTGTGPRAGKPRQPVPVTNVAAWNEFGTRGGGWGGPIPERPFFRQALKGAKNELMPILRANIDPNTMALDERTAKLLGLAMQGRIQRSITAMSSPPNTATTIYLKGSAKPLLDTGFLRGSVTFRIDRGR